MNKTKLLALLVPILYVVTVIANGLAASGALNGISTGEISDLYPVLFTPANYVFSIWSLIYFGLLAFSVYQVLPNQFNDASLNSVRGWFLVTSVLNSLWILTWQYQLLLPSLVIMLLLLGSLIGLYTQEQIGIVSVNKLRRWLVQAPFSLYLGWISVATIANVSVVLFDAGWNGWGLSDVTWTIIMMWVAVILSMVMLWQRKDVIFAGVVVWALIGIGVKNSQIQSIQYAMIAGVISIVVFGMICWQKQKRVQT